MATMNYVGEDGRQYKVQVRIVQNFGDGHVKVQRLDNWQYSLARTRRVI